MKEKKYCVYRHISPNGKVYIGFTSLSPNNRFRNGRGYLGNEYFAHAIAKYGWDNFEHEILETGLSLSAACEREVMYIQLFNSTNRNKGYNISPGGTGGIAHSEETKQKISASNSGKKRTDEAKRKLSERMRGTKFMLGVKHTAESREKMRGPRSNMLGEKNPKSRAVMQINYGGEVLAVFPSACFAEKVFSKSKHNCNISKCCRGEAKTAYGHVWRYANSE